MALAVGAPAHSARPDQRLPDGAWAVAAAARLVAATRPDALQSLRRELDAVLPGPRRRIVAALTPACPRSPVKVDGAAATGAELARLADLVSPDGWAAVRATVAGAERPVLVVAVPDGPAAGRPGVSAPPTVGSLFAIELLDTDPDPRAVEIAAGLCAVVAALYISRADETDPATLSENLAASQERARTISEMSEAHEAALTTVLSALRSNRLDDGAARAAATDAASTALVELRAVGQRDRALSEVPAGASFQRLAPELRALARNAGVTMELAPPEHPRILPGEVANGARAVTRGVVLAMLEQEGVSRLRVGWAPSADALTVVVRDDGPGLMAPEVLDEQHTSKRVAALDGRLVLDATPGWGTTITAELPLAPLASAERNPLAVLNDREREVLAEVARGHRNREVAGTLSISPNTVKFHVANILRKLDVGTRGEAALLARDHGLPPTTPTLSGRRPAHLSRQGPALRPDRPR